jgi:hypothetical protein
VTGSHPATLARTVWCVFCWAGPGKACHSPEGQHFARYLRAYRRGVIGKDTMIAVCLAIPRISNGQAVPDTPAPGRTRISQDKQAKN